MVFDIGFNAPSLITRREPGYTPGCAPLSTRSAVGLTRGTRPLTECSQHFAGGRCCSSFLTSFVWATEPDVKGRHLVVADPQPPVLDVGNQAANPFDLRMRHRDLIL